MELLQSLIIFIFLSIRNWFQMISIGQQLIYPNMQFESYNIILAKQHMQQEVKLLVGTSLEGQDQEFFIYRNSKLGEGGFGIVRRAVQAKNQNRPLAVKIIPYGGDPIKKGKIERQVAILRVLPDHPNLVRVLPYKCFSENNFYIFMELCSDGTLTDYVRKQGILQEETIFSIFYQLINGYRVLEEAGIVHQDLKLGNVLIKNGVLKITDFGFSILAQNYKTSLTRQGTLHYMPYEKLTDPNYVADSLSDIYSLGVIMFEVITKMHPYVNQKGIKTQKEFVIGLRSSSIVRPKLYATYSLQLQELFELVTRMCAKTRKNRATCQEIYNYVDTNDIFAPFRDKQIEPSVELHLPPLPIKIEEISTPVFLPFLVEPEEENEYLKKLSVQKENRLQEAHNKNIEKVENCILGHRLVLYFFDRLARRLIVEKAKEQLTGQTAHNYNRAILSCLVFEKRVTKQLIKYVKTPTLFAIQEIDNFKKSQIGKLCMKLIKRDEDYTQENINDHLKRTHQVEVKQQIALLDLAQEKDIELLLKRVKCNLRQCIKQRSCNVSQKRHLITLTYLFDGCTIISEYPKVQGLSLEDYFYKTETMTISDLTSKVMEEFNKQQSLPMPVFMLGEQQEDNEWI